MSAGGTKKGVVIEIQPELFDEPVELELVRDSYASDGGLGVQALKTEPDEYSGLAGDMWAMVTVNLPFRSPDAPEGAVYIDQNNISNELFEAVSALGTFTGEEGFSGYCSYPEFVYDDKVLGEMRDWDEFDAAHNGVDDKIEAAGEKPLPLSQQIAAAEAACERDGAAIAPPPLEEQRRMADAAPAHDEP